MLNKEFGANKVYTDLIDKKLHDQSQKMDANFISVWNEPDQKFYFFIERMFGRSVKIVEKKENEIVPMITIISNLDKS